MTIDYAAAVPVLRKAADLTEGRGWAIGELQTDAGCLCVHGAISTAACGVPWYVDTQDRHVLEDPRSGGAAILALHEYMKADPQPYRYRPDSSSRDAAACITQWNDYDANGGAVVVLALRNAATWAEGRVRARA